MRMVVIKTADYVEKVLDPFAGISIGAAADLKKGLLRHVPPYSVNWEVSAPVENSPKAPI